MIVFENCLAIIMDVLGMKIWLINDLRFLHLIIVIIVFYVSFGKLLRKIGLINLILNKQ